MLIILIILLIVALLVTLLRPDLTQAHPTLPYFLAITIVIALIILVIQYRSDLDKAYRRLASFDVTSLHTSLGLMNYVQTGSGEAVILSHGMFGGYDQGVSSMRSLLADQHHQIAVSRFGYLGTEVPVQPTPQQQAKAYRELLDHLDIDKAYIIGTSAGGPSCLQFALNYPERTKGLILLSSEAPSKRRTEKEIREIGMTGPPGFFVNDFPVWITLRHFGFIFDAMFGGQDKDTNLLETMLPVKERRPGVQIDTHYTNTDMSLNYADYSLEELTIPILVLHAKDDPMAKYENIPLLLERVEAKAVIYEDGGHLLEGKNAGEEILRFIHETR